MDERKLMKKKEKAKYEQNYDQLYNYCKELADVYLRNENNKFALLEYREAEDAAKKLNNKIYIAVANRMIGETLCAMGEFEEALKHQKIHLKYSREEENLVEEQRALATLGRTYFVKAESITNVANSERKHCLELCRSYYSKSLNICEKLSNTSQLSQKTLAEMKLRLFLNLGLSFESQGDVIVGIEYITKAINMCKLLELWEDLTRCYTAQGALYFRQGNTSKALSFYDEGLKVAERLEKKVQLSCELLCLKADVLIALSDYNGAKHVLIKAYKMKTLDANDRSDIEKKLKTVVVICKSENELLKTSETDYVIRKKLNETLGDCCVKLQNFENAITCYLKMLEYSVAMGLSRKDLIPIYYSLSQTYKDNKQFELALEYAQMEFQLIQDNSTEACKTLLNITEILELKRESLENIMEQYQKALNFARKSNDLKLEVLVLRSIKSTQIEYNRDDLAAETNKELDIIACCLPNEESDAFSEDSDEIQTPEDINLEELSDLYSSDDELTGREKHPRRKLAKASITRRNEKGETPLHVASAKGNIQLIKSLIQQGHPVNIPDAAGWSPLHEACNHGQVEAARILIESDAHIDDRGGPLCDGITPLLDAACNGHLEVITLLLKKGASPLARSNQGETALDCLLAWHERALAEGEVLDSMTQAYFDGIVEQLQDCLNKVGQGNQKYQSLIKNTNTNRILTVSETRSLNQKFTKAIDYNRKRTESDLVNDEQPKNAAREYQSAIDALRHRSKKNEVMFSGPIEVMKKPAFLAEEDIGDNWLDDDIHDHLNRPAKRRCEQFVGQQVRSTNGTSNSRAAIIPTSSTEATSLWNNDFSNVNLNTDDNEDNDYNRKSSGSSPIICKRVLPDPVINFLDDFPIDMDDDFVLPSSSNQAVNKSKLKSKYEYQKSLLSVGFTRFNPLSYSTQDRVTGTNLHANDRNISTFTTKSVNPIGNTHSVKVRIQGKLFLIPIPETQDNLNVGWLASEACRRYQNFEGVSPVLYLTTPEGALLDVNDPLSILINENEIFATVLSWNVAPLVDRYKEVCVEANIEVDQFLESRLDICQANACLEISSYYLLPASWTPVLKAISHYENLQKISLTAMYLQDKIFKALIDHVGKLQQIRSLDVSVNSLTNDGLSHFTKVLSSNSLQTIEELDLSYNPLGEESASCLANVSHNLPNLRVLNLKFVGLTSQALYGASSFMLDYIESLDVSYNKLEREGAAKFLSALNSGKIKSLNLSKAGGSEVFRECLLFLDRGQVHILEELYLEDLDIDDNDVEQLIQPLTMAKELTKLDLSNNGRISSDAHKKLSSLKSLKDLNLSGCGLLTSPHNLDLPFCQLNLSSTFQDNDCKYAPDNFITNATELLI